ncbi:MAG: tetratricopeptide repeat protein [Bacteroidia bacterium]
MKQEHTGFTTKGPARRCIAVLVFLVFFLTEAGAQKTTVYTDPDAAFKQGLELFSIADYAAAQDLFIRAAQHESSSHSLIRTDADYYSAVCAMELFHKDAEYLLKKFIHDYPESPRVRSVRFCLGKYNYRKKNYKAAVEWFNTVDVFDLNETEKAEFYFKRGYSNLETDSVQKAKSDLNEIYGRNTKYSIPAAYYYAHILYGEKKYESALSEFVKLEKDPTFEAVVPYYIAQIYFLRHRYEDVITYVPALLDSASTKRAPELARILGEAYFHTNRFKESIPYLERYHKTNALNRSDSYELGYAYFMASDYDPAIVAFKDATGVDDSLSQNANYHLGSCYLAKQNKHFAQNAFSEASRMHFNKAIREDALFSFAELTYELSYSPFNQAIQALQAYIAEYPNSARADEAYSYLVKINLVTKNYEDALKSIEQIRNLNEVLKPVYQQIAYNRGVELYTNFEFEQAVRHFAKAMKYPVDPVTNALAKYWTAEAFYQRAEKKGDQGLYETALENYKIYQVEAGAPRTPMYSTVQYNIGYTHYQLKEYPAAIIALRKFVLDKSAPPDKVCDACMRIGDCYYVSREFSAAADFYDQAVQTKTSRSMEKDYALYQRGMSLGLEKKYEAKINALSSLLSLYPKSGYIPAARFEVAHTYQLIDRPEEAVRYYNMLIAENNGSPYMRRCYSQMGLIYENQSDYDHALICYKKVVDLDKHSEEANNVLPQIRHIYAEVKKDPPGYVTYLQGIGEKPSNSQIDSITYKIARDYYGAGDCANAAPALAKYLNGFPSGIFSYDALYMKAECDLKNNKPEDALTGYKAILNLPPGKYTEPALRRSAAICYNRKDYAPAYEYYLRLEALPAYAFDARIGMMRSAWALLQYDNASGAANKVLSSENLPPETALEAHLVIARTAIQTQNYNLAYNEYGLVKAGPKNETAAEAAYYLAQIQYQRKEFKPAEKSIFEIIRQQAGYKTWAGKAFLLLSDNYLAQADTFHAKFILNDFIKNTELPDLKTQAQEKLTRIMDAEKAKPVQEEKDILVPINNEKDKQLFEEDKKGDMQR